MSYSATLDMLAGIGIPNVDSDVSAEDEAAALAKVASFLENTSLDSMLNLASESLEERTRARYERDRT